MKEILKRLKNTGTLVSVACAGGLLLNQFGLNIELEWLNTTINLVCTLGIALGVLNDTTTKGLDNPFKYINKKN